MKVIIVEKVEEGMVLSADVTDASGNTLLGAGTVLTAKHRTLLERREIASVRIKDEEDEPTTPPAETISKSTGEAEGGDVSEEALATIEHMFESVMSDPLMVQLFGKARKYAAKKATDD